jgi:hypothetical protein
MVLSLKTTILLLLASSSNAFVLRQRQISRFPWIVYQAQQPDWLSKPEKDKEAIALENTLQQSRRRQQQQQREEEEGFTSPEEAHIPTTGVSVSDMLEEVGKTQFDTQLVPITGLAGVAQIVTTSMGDGGLEPVRYLVRLTPSSSSGNIAFAMTDVPPYSASLVSKMRRYMGSNGTLSAILITSRDAIHYNDAPAVFTTRRSDLYKWKAEFGDIHVAAYRLDIPRDCSELVTQRLDGHGPWAADSDNMTLVESGRPLTYENWDEETTKGIIDKGETPPDADMVDEDEEYSPLAIRRREEGKAVLAIYTPGHSFGTVSYVFPHMKAVVSGYTIPIEDDRDQDSPGPALDCRGYVTTSMAGLKKKMESARHLVETYSDRFKVILPSRSDPMFLPESVPGRTRALLRIVEEYEKLGQVYEQLGILSDNDDDDE